MIDVAAQWKCCDTNAPPRNYFPSAVGGMQLRGCAHPGHGMLAMNFASDNTAGVAPPILDAIVAPNRGFALGYGHHEATGGGTRHLSEVFVRDVAAVVVAEAHAEKPLTVFEASVPCG